MNLLKRVRDYSVRKNLWQKNFKIVLGVSGGPDSVCLLDVFAKLAPKYSLELHLAHVNYGLRGRDSLRDEKLVEKLAKKYGLPLTIFLPEPVSGPNLEKKLRDIRYRFFEELRKNIGFDHVAVAHNQDDQAETFLMRLLRGSGSQGLSAMLPKNGRIIRPLLNTSRKEIISYLKSHKLSHHFDKTNTSPDFSRNLIRHKIIPSLEKLVNPNLKTTLSRSASILSAEDDYIQKSALKYIKNGSFESASRFLALHPALQRQVLREKIRLFRGNLLDIGAAQIEEMLKALKSPKSKNQTVRIGGLKLTRKGDRVILS